MSINEFTDIYFSTLLDKVSIEKKSIIILGDFNVDLIQCSNDTKVSEYFNLLSSHNLLPYVTLPTRITGHSRTLIDNIFSNFTDPQIISGNLTSTISDHLPQFFIYPNMNKNFIPRKHNIYKRNLTNYDRNKLASDFKNLDWDVITRINDNDLNKSFDLFFSEFNNLLDAHAPLKKLSIKNFKRRFKPWITLGIITSLKIKNSLYKKFTRAKDNESKISLEARFKNYRNMLVLLMRKSKEIHFKNFFLSNAKNIREVWKGIKNIIQVNNNKNSFPTCILDNDLSLTDPTSIAEKFNSYFTSIANDIKSKIYSSHTNFYKYLKIPNAHSFFLSPTSSLEISELISK